MCLLLLVLAAKISPIVGGIFAIRVVLRQVLLIVNGFGCMVEVGLAGS